jgi:alkaline phosphatase
MFVRFMPEAPLAVGATPLHRWAVVALLCLTAAPTPTLAQGTGTPTRLILFVGDGVGVSYWSAAAFAADRLAVHQFPVVGLVDVRASNNRVTDSAAGATAYAAGVRTYNGAIGMGPDTTAVETLVEVAAQRGLATGLVATSSVTHATPASFAAHVVHRSMEWEIARQLAGRGLTVLLGGGRGYFDRRVRPDSADLLRDMRRDRTYVETTAALAALDPDTVRSLVGLFAVGQMPPALRAEVARLADPGHSPTDPARTAVVPAETTWVAWRSPTLAEMTRAALEVMNQNPHGFFLMVEASQPDWRGHGNEPLATVVGEMLDFDAAIRAALEYQERYPETLIVVVSDHETGGLALVPDQRDSLVAGYSTTNHTAAWIPLFARGPGAEEFGGVQQNYEIGRRLLAMVRGR